MKVIRFIANAALDSIKLSTKYRSLIPRPSSEQLLNLSKDIEERAEQFEKVLPRLLILSSSNPETVREQIQQEIDRMKKDELVVLLNQIRAIGSPASSECGGG